MFENIVLENAAYTITFLVLFFSVAGFLKQSNETPTSIQVCIGLVDVELWSKILGNRLGILTSVLIAMDFFSDVRKVLSIYKITNAYVKHMSRKLFCLLRNWICLLQNYFLSHLYLKDIYKALKGIGKTQFMSGVNNFAKSVNF